MTRLAVYTARMTEGTRWILFAVLGAIFAAVVQITSKLAFKANDKLDPDTVNVIRSGITTAFLIAVILYDFSSRQARSWINLSERSGQVAMAWVVASGLGAALSWFFGYRALKLIGVSKSYPIDKLSVVIGVLLAVLLLGERPSGLNWTGVVLMVLGAALVTIPKGQNVMWLMGGAK